MNSSPHQVTELLRRWSNGEQDAFDALVPIVYEGLRQLAHDRRRGERTNISLNTTGLVHEAYLKLADLRQASFHDRAHFLAMASRVMRRLLVDHARARKAEKRGNDVVHLELHDDLGITAPQASMLIDLDDALQQLALVDPRACDVLEQHFFGDLTLDEIAESLGVSRPTVKRDLRFAKAWLAVHLEASKQP